MTSAPSDRVDQRRVRADDACRRRRGCARAACVPGSITASASISTSASIQVEAGSVIVTPASMWRSRIRRRASRADDGELGAVVDADVDAHVVDLVDEDPPALLAQQRQHVAEVVLARGVVGRRSVRARRRGRSASNANMSVLTSRIASTSGGTPSGCLVSTMRSNSPFGSRTTRPQRLGVVEVDAS